VVFLFGQLRCDTIESVPPGEDHNKIQDLKESLYSRNAPDVRTRRKLRFTDSESNVKTSWEDSSTEPQPEEVQLNTVYKDHSMSFLTKLFIGSAVFCAVALSIGAFLFFKGSNLISASNIDIQITGPVSIPGGEEVSFDIKVVNKNNVDLMLADLEVEFPEGTTNPADPTQEMKVYRELLGDIRAGGKSEKTVKAVIFGEENLQKTITFNVTYKVKGSTSLFTKNKTFDILINSSPIVLKTSAFKEVTSGQDFDITVSLKSNSEQVLKNVLLKSQYPFGYTFNQSNIPPLAGNTTWKVGDIGPGAEKKVVIRGNLKGENTDARVFKFEVGAQSSTDPKAIGTPYMTAEQHITIEKPFISTQISIDNDEGGKDYPSEAGAQKRVTITWFNNLQTAVSNVQIVAKLSGTAYDRGSVFPDDGYYKSSDDSIVWNRQTTDELTSVGGGESGSVSFSVTPRAGTSGSNPITNPVLTISANVTGDRVGEGSVPTVTSAATRNIRIQSSASLSSRVVRSIGPFKNTGPIPPQVDKISTYTIYWNVDNTTNPVSGAKVVATLPPNVKFIGVVDPQNENITYDSNASSVIWSVGTVPTYTRQTSKMRTVAFQVSLEPNLPQVGESPVLVNPATLTASDDFAGVKLSDRQDALTTRFSTDPAYKAGDETVVK
jgi:hypothetical protein